MEMILRLFPGTALPPLACSAACPVVIAVRGSGTGGGGRGRAVTGSGLVRPVGFNYYAKGLSWDAVWLVDQHGMIGRCVSTRDLPDVLPNPGLARAPRPQQRR